MENMRFKVGDRVKIKSLDWYNKHKDMNGNIFFGTVHAFNQITAHCCCGKVYTIVKVNCLGWYEVEEEAIFIKDEMIEGLVEEEVDFEKMYMESEKRYEEEYSRGEYCHEQSFKWGFQEGYDYAHENEKLEINLKNGYQFVDENGNVINATKIVLEKKKKECPKTFLECCDVLNIGNLIERGVKGYKAELFDTFQKLLICRNAYWKLAGEEMGLDKPWSPTDSDYITGRYCIFVHRGNIICSTPAEDCPFTFPTDEMRDAFKENFDKDLEFCKELL